MTGRRNMEMCQMRRILIAIAVLGAAGLVAAAWASGDRAASTQDSLQPGVQAPSRTESLRRDGEEARAPRDERSHEGRERRRDEHKEARGNDEDDDD
jgi:hypothetical protein